MQCVIICAGKGTRMRPLTDTLAKPLILVCGKPILEHIIDALPQEIDELILVVGYLKEQIINHCGDVYKGKKVTYVAQENYAGGTGEALMLTKPYIKEKFLFMNGDDIHGAIALANIVKYEHAILASRSEKPERYGVLELNNDGTLASIIEKPEKPPSNLINTGCFVLTPEIFKYCVLRSSTGELYATDIVTAYAQEYPLMVLTQELWVPIGYPEHIAQAETILGCV